MGKKKTAICNDCESQRLVEQESPNHILHLLLTFITVGLWLLIWIGQSIRWGGYRCTTCGSKDISKVR